MEEVVYVHSHTRAPATTELAENKTIVVTILDYTLYTLTIHFSPLFYPSRLFSVALLRSLNGCFLLAPAMLMTPSRAVEHLPCTSSSRWPSINRNTVCFRSPVTVVPLVNKPFTFALLFPFLVTLSLFLPGAPPIRCFTRPTGWGILHDHPCLCPVVSKQRASSFSPACLRWWQDSAQLFPP